MNSPIIIHKNSHVTKLILSYYHRSAHLITMSRFVISAKVKPSWRSEQMDFGSLDGAHNLPSSYKDVCSTKRTLMQLGFGSSISTPFATFTFFQLLTFQRDWLMPGKCVKEDMYSAKSWHRVHFLTEQFWSQWNTWMRKIKPALSFHKPKMTNLNLKVDHSHHQQIFHIRLVYLFYGKLSEACPLLICN